MSEKKKKMLNTFTPFDLLCEIFCFLSGDGPPAACLRTAADLNFLALGTGEGGLDEEADDEENESSESSSESELSSSVPESVDEFKLAVIGSGATGGGLITSV